MRCVFALLPDEDVHNIFRKKTLEIDNLINNGFTGAILPPHISLKQSFVFEDLKNIENYFDNISSYISPTIITFDKYMIWENVITANIKEQETLRKIHNKLNIDLMSLCENPKANYDGENYHFHLTVAYGGEGTELYKKAYETLCKNSINIETVIKRICMMYYKNNDDGVGKFVTYKINKL